MNKLFCCLWDGKDLPGYSAGQYDTRHVLSLAKTFHPVNLHVFTDEVYYPRMLGAMTAQVHGGFSYDLHRLSDSMMTIGGWAPMLSVFSPNNWPEEGERHILVGLDTVAVDDTGWLWEWDEAPIGLPRDPYHPARTCNAVTSWNREGAELVWNMAQTKPATWLYAGHPSEMMLLRKLWMKHGWTTFDDTHPGALCSYKAHIQKRGATHKPENCSVVYFHGKPKPQDLDEDDWVREAWGF